MAVQYLDSQNLTAVTDHAPGIAIDESMVWTVRELPSPPYGVDIWDREWNHLGFYETPYAGRVAAGLCISGPYLVALYLNTLENPGKTTIAWSDKDDPSTVLWSMNPTELITGVGLAIQGSLLVCADNYTPGAPVSTTRAFDIETGVQVWERPGIQPLQGVAAPEGFTIRGDRYYEQDRDARSWHVTDPEGNLISDSSVGFPEVGGSISERSAAFIADTAVAWGRYTSTNEQFVLMEQNDPNPGDADRIVYDQMTGPNGTALDDRPPDTVGSMWWFDSYYARWTVYSSALQAAIAANSSSQGDQSMFIDVGVNEYIIDCEFVYNSTGKTGIEFASISRTDRAFYWLSGSGAATLSAAYVVASSFGGSVASNSQLSLAYGEKAALRVVRTEKVAFLYLNGRQVWAWSIPSALWGSTYVGIITNASNHGITNFRVQALRS